MPGLKLFKGGFDLGGDETERGFEAFGGVEAAEAGFDGGGFAEAGEELIGGEAFGGGLVDLGAGAEDALAGVEGEDGITEPSVGENFFLVGFGRHGGKRVAW